MLRSDCRPAAADARWTRLSTAQKSSWNLLRHEAASRRSRSDIICPQEGHVQVNQVYLVLLEPVSNGSEHRRRSSVNFSWHKIFSPKKICIKNQQNARIIIIIIARKIFSPNFRGARAPLPPSPKPMAPNFVVVGWGSCCYQIFKVLKLFRFSTDRNLTSATDWWQYSGFLHRVEFLSCLS